LRHGEETKTINYYISDSGDYNIQVLQKALQNENIYLRQIDTLEQKKGSNDHNMIVSNMQHVQAFLIHQNNHYYCLRRFRLNEDYFFKIDSKSSQNHEPIFRENISKYIDDLIRNKSANIYVILEYVENGDNRQLSMDNIKKRLWALPDAPADG
jgi:serine/threonine protein kinase